MAYTKLGWVNDQAPALNQTNLNHMDQGIYDAHQELAEYEDIFTGEVADLKSALNEFKDGFHNLNLFGDATLLGENKYASIDNGHIALSGNSDLNAYLLPVDGTSTYTFTMCRFAFLVDSDAYTAIGSLLQNVTQVNSTGASYICFSVNKTNYPLATYQVSKGNTLVTGFDLPNWFNNVVDPLQDNVSYLEYVGGVNLFKNAILLAEGKYASVNNGHIALSNSESFNAYLLPVDGVSTYNFTYVRFGALVEADKYTVIGSQIDNVTSITSTGATYIVFSFNKTTYPIASYEIYGIRPIVSKESFAYVAGNIASGGNLYIGSAKTNLRKGERIVFEGDITSFSSFKIGLSVSTSVGTATNQINTFVIDGTNVSYYQKSSSTPIVVAHNLTIANNIQIILEMSDVATLKFALFSSGNAFEYVFTDFKRQSVGLPFVLSVGTALTNCKLSWTCEDINKNIWMFGDSYFAYSPQRWTYYLHEHGYDKNALLDGFAGEGGVNGRVAFGNLLTFGTPKYAVWCLGMNDGSDSQTEPSSSWVTQRDIFLNYCNSNKVTPMFGTIPTVPSINHEKKNEWIRSSGYRYIDFAKAVGANSSGVWYSGMLSSDNVHPTEQGARALFARVLLDLPEIMIDDFGY